MIKDAPIRYRNGDYPIVCLNCNHEQLELQTPTSFEYFEKTPYLDDFREGMETEYFESKFQKCENCDNFAPTLKMNWARKIRYDETLKKLWESDKPELEKRFLLAHMIEPSFQTVLDLYWYYDFNDQPKEASKLREKLMKEYKEAYEDEQSLYGLRMYVELLRREGEFRKAIRLAKKGKFLPNNEINRELAFSSPYELDMLEQEIALCKEKNSARALFVKK